MEKFRSTVYFLHVIQPLALFEEDRRLDEEALKKKAKEYFERFEEKVLSGIKINFTYKFVIKTGSPADEICKFAEEKNITLIAMATHGYSGILRWALGSVADKVVRYSSKPVLLLPKKGRNQG